MKRLNWIDEIVLPFAVAVLNAAWLTLWLRWIDRFLGAPVVYPAPAGLVALSAGAAYLTRFALGHIQELNRARLAVVLSGRAALLHAARPVYPGGFPAGFLRGLVNWGGQEAGRESDR